MDNIISFIEMKLDQTLMDQAIRRVAAVGLGAMGAPMAARLLKAGWAVRAADIDAAARARFAAAGGTACASAAEAAAQADVLLVMVHTAAQADEVLFGAAGAAPALAPRAVVWLASTVTPAYARELAARLAGHGLSLVDGPVSGGVGKAADGTLTVMAGGDAAALDRAGLVMQACAARIYRVGEAGAGSTFKMINQLLTASHIALAAEAVALGARAGIDPALLVEVIRESAGTSVQFERRAPRMLAGDHTPHSTVHTFLKDLGIALDAGRSLDFPLPLAAAANQVFTMAAALGHGRASDTRVVSVYESFGAPVQSH